MDDIQGVDDIAKRLAHLPAMSVTHDSMEIDLGAHNVTNSEATILPVLMALPRLPARNRGFLGAYWLGVLVCLTLSLSAPAREEEALGQIHQQPPGKAGKETRARPAVFTPL